MTRIISLIAVTAVMLVSDVLPEGIAQTLSVKESLQLAKTTYYERPDKTIVEKYYRANPAVRPLLYAVMANNAQMEYWPPVVGFFAYVGQTEDVIKLKAFVFQHQGVLDGSTYRSVSKVFDALGEMSRRGVTEAGNLLHKMAKPSFWENAPFVLYAEHPPTYPSQKYMLALEAIRGLAYALDPTFDDATNAMLHSYVGTNEQKAFLESRLGGLKDFYTAWKNEVKTGRLGGIAHHPNRRHANNKESVGIDNQSSPTKSSDHPVPVDISVTAEAPWTDVTPPEKAKVKAIIQEAQKNYKSIISAIRKGQFDQIMGQLLDNGRPLGAKKLTAQPSPYNDDLAREQPILAQLAALDAPLADLHITQIITYATALNGASTLGLKKREIITVTYSLLGTNDLTRQHMPNQNVGNSLTVSSDGTLVVMMKKIDGKWYWNPFGW